MPLRMLAKQPAVANVRQLCTRALVYTDKPALTRSDIESLPGPVLLDFGTNVCGHCTRASPFIAYSLLHYEKQGITVKHIRVEDGKGRGLGRSYKVKLWPTLVFIRHGKELSRVVRPLHEAAILEGLALVCSSDDNTETPAHSKL